MFKFKTHHILLHILGWAILLCGPLIGRDIIHTPLLIKSIVHTIGLATLFYFNMYLLIPNFLFEKKLGRYVTLLFLAVVFTIAVNYLFDQWFFDIHHIENRAPIRFNHRHPISFRLFPSILSTLFVVGISTSLKVIDEYLKKEKRQKEIENEKLNSELTFLRYQINPHFLFNTLNNIYSLTQTGSKNVDQSILKLSELMRYMLEENEREFVSLKKEIYYVKNYLELQKLRVHDSVKIETNIQDDDTGHLIEPLLLIPFIENAFKHGISYSQNSYITIDIKVVENKLLLHVENSLPRVPVEKDKASGIGLVNVKKRLKLLYPEKHTLFINSFEDKFVVHLVVDL